MGQGAALPESSRHTRNLVQQLLHTTLGATNEGFTLEGGGNVAIDKNQMMQRVAQASTSTRVLIAILRHADSDDLPNLYERQVRARLRAGALGMGSRATVGARPHILEPRPCCMYDGPV